MMLEMEMENYFIKNGSYYIGGFKNGERDGDGEEFDKDGKMVRFVTYKNGEWVKSDEIEGHEGEEERGEEGAEEGAEGGCNWEEEGEGGEEEGEEGGEEGGEEYGEEGAEGAEGGCNWEEEGGEGVGHNFCLGEVVA